MTCAMVGIWYVRRGGNGLVAICHLRRIIWRIIIINYGFIIEFWGVVI